MRMSVALARTAVRRTARMRDAARRVQGLLVERVLESRHLTDGTPALDLRVAIQHGETGRVVTAILEPPQSFHEHGNDVAFGDGAYDAAHSLSAPSITDYPSLDRRPAG